MHRAGNRKAAPARLTPPAKCKKPTNSFSRLFSVGVRKRTKSPQLLGKAECGGGCWRYRNPAPRNAQTNSHYSRIALERKGFERSFFIRVISPIFPSPKPARLLLQQSGISQMARTRVCVPTPETTQPSHKPR